MAITTNLGLRKPVLSDLFDLETDLNENWVKIDDAQNVINVKWATYGAEGDGVTDDTAAINNAIAAMVAGQTLFFPKGVYRITSQIVITKAINLKGTGVGSEIEVDITTNPTTTNAIAVSDVQGVFFENLAFAGASGSCKSALYLSDVHRSRFSNLYFNVGAANAALHLEGGLINTFDHCVVTGNFSYPSGGLSQKTDPLYGILFEKGTLRCNANVLLNCVVEDATSHGLYINGDGGSGFNNYICGGTFEGNTGYGIYYKNARDGWIIEGVHLEGNASGDLKLDSVLNGRLYTESSTSSIELVGARNVHVSGRANTLTIDSNSSLITVTNFTYGLYGGDIADSGINTIYGTLYYSGAAGLYHKTRGVGFDFVNLFKNGNLDRWPDGASAVPDGFAGGGIAWTREATIKKFGDYSVKINPPAATSPRIVSGGITGFTYVVGDWYTVTLWAYVPTGTANLALQIWFDGGAETVSLDSTSTKDVWVKLQGSFQLQTGYSAMQMNFAGPEGNSFYVDGITINRGIRGPATFVIPERLDVVLDDTVIWDPGNLADGAGETKSLTVTGAALGDFVRIAAPYDLQDMVATGYVQAADTVEIRLQNETGGAIDLASGTWKVQVTK